LMKMHRQMADMMKKMGKGKGLMASLFGGGAPQMPQGAGLPGLGGPKMQLPPGMRLPPGYPGGKR
ncbi:MAG: signal recognition particle protein, partial [Micropepsaceae bacterium]